MDPMETTVGAGSSSKLILSIIAIVVVVGIGYATFRSGKDVDDESKTSDEATLDEGKFSGSLFDLASRDGSWKCTWTTTTDDATMTGTVFVDGGKFKSEAEIKGAGTSLTADTIGDGTYVYSWSSMMPTTGFKFRIPEGTTASPEGSATQSEGLSEMYDYTCEPWNADSAAFALPSGVTFTETTTVR